MMIVEIDSLTFPLITFIIREKSIEKLRSPRARWKNRENVLASANEIQANFLLFMHEKIPHTGNARLHCL